MNRRLGVHALLRTNVPKSGIARGIIECLGVGVRTRVVADEMEMVPARCRDAERLLHQAIRLVAVSVRALLLWHLDIRVASTSTFWSLASSYCCRGCCCQRRGEATAATLALHLSVGQETTGYPAGTPRFSVRPPPHACLSLVPHKD